MTSRRAESPIGPAERPFTLRQSRAHPIAILLLLLSPALHAGDVVVVDAAADCRERVCRFDVTLRHDDTGWDHYADQWRILAPDGTVLGTRTLYHPHVDEQPFTRSLDGVSIPAGVSNVVVEARDTVHGTSEHTLTLELYPQ